MLGLGSAFEVKDLGTLAADGAGAAVQTAGYDLTFQVTVSGIGTNVVVRLEGSLDGVDYGSLRDSSGSSDFTITANGTTLYGLRGPVQWVRLRRVSASGGTPSISGKVGCAFKTYS